MYATKAGTRPAAVLDRVDFHLLFEAISNRGFRIIGPTVRDGAIVYDEIAAPEALPVGWADGQESGTYRLERRKDGACFGYNVGPHAWKRFLHPSELVLWEARRKRTDKNLCPVTRMIIRRYLKHSL